MTSLERLQLIAQDLAALDERELAHVLLEVGTLQDFKRRALKHRYRFSFTIPRTAAIDAAAEDPGDAPLARLARTPTGKRTPTSRGSGGASGGGDPHGLTRRGRGSPGGPGKRRRAS